MLVSAVQQSESALCIHISLPLEPPLTPSSLPSGSSQSAELSSLRNTAASTSCPFYTVLLFSRVWFFVTPYTVAHLAPLSMGLFRKQYWSRLPFPSPKDLPKPRDGTLISCIGRQILYLWDTREAPWQCIYAGLLSQFILPTPSPAVSTSPFSMPMAVFLPTNRIISMCCPDYYCS